MTFSNVQLGRSCRRKAFRSNLLKQIIQGGSVLSVKVTVFVAVVLILSVGRSTIAAPTCDVNPRECLQGPTRASIRASLLHGAAGSSESYLIRNGSFGSRSIPLAFGMSAILPGAGQAYNGHWTKAVIAFALEATAIAIWTTSRSNGLDAEDDFRAFAHQDWAPDKYAEWINDYTDFLEAEHGANVLAPSIAIVSGVDFQNPNSWTSEERSAVLQMFGQIQTVERELFHPETGASFSHQIPNFGEQQYYELIGKYFQFAPGWNDYPEWIDEDGNFTAAIDPEKSGPNNSKPNVSSNFFDYASDHADAQDLLRRASHVSLIVVANHVIAAIDAAVSAKLHNDRISTSMGFSYSPDGDPVPTAYIRYRL